MTSHICKLNRVERIGPAINCQFCGGEFNKMKIAFDIDGTLDEHNWLHQMLRTYAEDGHDVIVWSGGGIDYAKRYVERNELPARVVEKCSEPVDIAFDDAYDHIAGATITIQVPYKN